MFTIDHPYLKNLEENDTGLLCKHHKYGPVIECEFLKCKYRWCALEVDLNDAIESIICQGLKCLTPLALAQI